jgi:hypothetical protein
MKKMDYSVGGGGRIRTITGLSDRAKNRTPEPLEFDIANAKEFLKSSQAEGFRFSGAELIDPAQKLVKNRYFFIGDGGQLIPCGDDWGPLDTVWEVGDVMPGRERNTGTQAVVEQIVKGEMAQKMGCSIAFILRLRNIAGMN